jgi:hypothetical protein
MKRVLVALLSVAFAFSSQIPASAANKTLNQVAKVFPLNTLLGKCPIWHLLPFLFLMILIRQ